MIKTVGIHKQTSHAFCGITYCRNKAEYYIGRDDVKSYDHLNICGSCVKNLVETIPDELRGPDKMIIPLNDIDVTSGSIEVISGIHEVIEGIPVFTVNADDIDLEATLNDLDNTPVPPSDDAEDFECAQCGKSFKTERGLNIHISQVHED